VDAVISGEAAVVLVPLEPLTFDLVPTSAVLVTLDVVESEVVPLAEVLVELLVVAEVKVVVVVVATVVVITEVLVAKVVVAIGVVVIGGLVVTVEAIVVVPGRVDASRHSVKVADTGPRHSCSFKHTFASRRTRQHRWIEGSYHAQLFFVQHCSAFAFLQMPPTPFQLAVSSELVLK
jgi:hypothetical protein